MVIVFFSIAVCLSPYELIDEENFLFVNIIQTPEHIKPEWYFSLAYCILRRVPSKLGGVVGLVMRVLVLLLVPYIRGGL